MYATHISSHDKNSSCAGTRPFDSLMVENIEEVTFYLRPFFDILMAQIDHSHFLVEVSTLNSLEFQSDMLHNLSLTISQH